MISPHRGLTSGSASILLVALLAVSAVAEARELESPSTIALGGRRHVDLLLPAPGGTGEVSAQVNVGAIKRLKMHEDGARVRLRLRLPGSRSPQELLVLLYRADGEARLHRIALLGRTRLPISAKPRSRLILRYGKTELSRKMGYRRRRRFRLVIPPGVDVVKVELVDKSGKKTERDVKVQRPAYRRLLVLLRPQKNSQAKRRFRVIVFVAEPRAVDQLLVSARAGVDGEWQTLEATRKGPGRYEALLTPRQIGSYTVRAQLEDPLAGGAVESRESNLVQAQYVVPRPVSATTQPKIAIERAAKPKPAPRRLHFDFALAVGALHNIGEVFSPHFALGVGVSYSFGRHGSLGLRFGAGIAWASQAIAGPPLLGNADARVLIIPLTLGPLYRGPPSWPVIPYARLAFALTLVRSQSEASFTEERASLDAAPGVLGQLGGELPLGPVFAFAEFGFLYSRVDSPEIGLLAGGLLAEFGVRFYL